MMDNLNLKRIIQLPSLSFVRALSFDRAVMVLVAEWYNLRLETRSREL